MSKESLRNRFLRDQLPIRLGNLAANLSRIGRVEPSPKNVQYVKDQIRESMYFIEWTAAEFPAAFWEPLIGLQLTLAAAYARGEAWLLSAQSGAMRESLSEAADRLIDCVRQWDGTKEPALRNW